MSNSITYNQKTHGIKGHHIDPLTVSDDLRKKTRICKYYPAGLDLSLVEFPIWTNPLGVTATSAKGGGKNNKNNRPDLGNFVHSLPHKLKIISSEPMEIRCSYCGRNQNVDEIVDYII